MAAAAVPRARARGADPRRDPGVAGAARRCRARDDHRPDPLQQGFTDHGTVERQRIDDEGRAFGAEREILNPGPYAYWTSPVVKRRSVVAFGADIGRTTDELVMGRAREADKQPGWLEWTTAAIWSVQPQMFTDGSVIPGQGLRALQVKNKKLPGGVPVVGEGAAIPLSVIRRDGWRLDYTPSSALARQSSTGVEPEGDNQAKGTPGFLGTVGNH